MISRVAIFDAPWLQIRIAGCDHTCRQKEPLLDPLPACDHKGLLKFVPWPQIRIAGCDHKGRQKQLFDARTDNWPSPEQPEAGVVSGVGTVWG